MVCEMEEIVYIIEFKMEIFLIHKRLLLKLVRTVLLLQKSSGCKRIIRKNLNFEKSKIYKFTISSITMISAFAFDTRSQSSSLCLLDVHFSSLSIPSSMNIMQTSWSFIDFKFVRKKKKILIKEIVKNIFSSHKTLLNSTNFLCRAVSRK